MRSLPLFEYEPPKGMLEGDRCGETFDRERDLERLDTLMGRVFRFMRDGQWHTLAEINAACGGTEASCSARLRDLRKPKFGGWQVSHAHCGKGLWKYRLAGKALT